MATREVDYLLIGGGLASANCARWLREEGAEGTVLLVGREPDPPYNRPNCSKGYLRGEEERAEAFFRPDEWWAEQNIELLKRTSVTALDLDARTAKLSTKEEISFGKALIATGANVRRLNVPGCELEQIHYLRTLSNADAIREGVADAEHVVLIGGSYIGCEVAASLTAIGKRCTIVMQERATLERGFGGRVGRHIQGLLESVGVSIHGEDELERFEGEGRVAKVITRVGLELAGRRGRDRRGRHTRYAAGPARRPCDRASAAGSPAPRGWRPPRRACSPPGTCASTTPCCTVVRMRIEHWDVAFNHGKTAALNMLGRDVPHTVVPYFFSVLANLGELEYVGPAASWDEEIVRGSLDGWQVHQLVPEGRTASRGAHVRTLGRSRPRPEIAERAHRARREAACCARRRRRATLARRPATGPAAV